MNKKQIFIALCSLGMVSVVQAETAKGFSGYLTVPNAQVLDFGQLSLSYNNFLHPHFHSRPNREAENYVFGVGAFNNLEVFVRLAEVHRQGHDPHKYGDFDTRDLIGSVKYRYAFNDKLALAIGGHDIAGLAVNERRFYAVADWQENSWQASLGYAIEDEANSTRKDSLNGVLAGLEWRPLNFASLMGEFDGLETRAGLKLQWNKIGGSRFDVFAHSIVYSSLASDATSLQLGFRWALGSKPGEHPNSATSMKDTVISVPDSKIVEPVTRTFESQQSFNASSVPTDVLKPVAEGVSDSAGSAQDLANALLESGVNQVRVFQDADHLHVVFENQAFSRGELDAVEAALAELASSSWAKGFDNFSLWVMKEGLALFKVEANSAWLAQKFGYEASAEAAPANLSVTPEMHLAAPGVLLAQAKQADWGELMLSPEWRANYGSEVGVMDYSLALNARFSLPLWIGANVKANYQTPVSNSHHYSEGGFFESLAYKSRWSDAGLFQTFKLSPEFVNQSSVGYSVLENKPYYYAGHSARWNVQGGRHQFYGEAMYFRAEDREQNWRSVLPIDRTIKVAGYEFLWPEKNLAINYEFGQYFNQDMSDKLSIKSFLGDGYFLVQFAQSDYGWQYVGAGISLPLWSKKNIDVSGLKVTGNTQWLTGMITTTDNPLNSNANYAQGSGGFIRVALKPQLLQTLQKEQREGKLTPAFIENELKR